MTDWEDLEGMETHEHPDYADRAYEKADLARKREKEEGPPTYPGYCQDLSRCELPNCTCAADAVARKSSGTLEDLAAGLARAEAGT